MYLHAIIELQKHAKESFFKMSGYRYENLKFDGMQEKKNRKVKGQKEVKILSVQAVCLKCPLL